MRRLVLGSGRYTKCRRAIRAIGITQVACACSGSAMGGLLIRVYGPVRVFSLLSCRPLGLCCWEGDTKSAYVEKQLLEAIAFYIQSVKPELIPKPPFTTSPTEAESVPPSVGAGKQLPPKSKTKLKGKTGDKDKPTQQLSRKRLPQPPQPRAPLASSVSAYSPALPSGVLVETIKAGMSAAAAENAAAPQGAGKGKRKVVRVRG